MKKSAILLTLIITSIFLIGIINFVSAVSPTITWNQDTDGHSCTGFRIANGINFYLLKATVRYDSDAQRNLSTIKNVETGDTICEDQKAGDICVINEITLNIDKVGYVRNETSPSGYNRWVELSIVNGNLIDNCVVAATSNCADSDGGLNPEIWGATSTINPPVSGWQDACQNANTLLERYCNGATMQSAVVDCPNGCSDGVCKKSSGNDATTNIYMCNDTDGLNFYLPGITYHGFKIGEIYSTSAPDYCTGGDGIHYYGIREYYCQNGYSNYQDYTCPHYATYSSPGLSICYCICVQDSECPTNYACKSGLCTPKCTESWSCSSWSTCTNSQQTKTCTDSNSCGTTANKPALNQSCTSGACSESWSCTDWSSCIDEEKTRTCADTNHCNTTANKPSTSATCALETNQTQTTPTTTNTTISNTTNENNLVDLSCSGCKLDNNCRPYGFRTQYNSKASYCDVDGQFKEQRLKDANGEWAKCDNSYECTSNICSSDECIELKDLVAEANGFKAFFVKLLCKLTNLFSSDGYAQCAAEYLA